MYMLKAEHVRMIEVTATDLRKDLFNILDRMVETGESVRLVRKGKVVSINMTTKTPKPKPKGGPVGLTPTWPWALGKAGRIGT